MKYGPRLTVSGHKRLWNMLCGTCVHGTGPCVHGVYTVVYTVLNSKKRVIMRAVAMCTVCTRCFQVEVRFKKKDVF